jgi:hypothetical protein
VEALAAQIYRGGLDGADPGRTVVNIMLPRGVVLVKGFSPGFRPPPGQEAEHGRRPRRPRRPSPHPPPAPRPRRSSPHQPH